MATTQAVTSVEDIPRIPHAEAMELARAQNDSFLAELKALDSEDWEKVTDCAPWTVRDIAAHVLAWGEASLSPKEMAHQMSKGFRVRKDWPNVVDAQNAVQVEERKDLTPAELVSRLESTLPRFVKLRDRLSPVLKPIPTYNGLLGWISVGVVAETILTRDTFVHRIDIAEATGKPMHLGPFEKRIVADCVKEWAKGSKADAIVELSGPAGGSYRLGSGVRATIKSSPTDLTRILSGRPRGGSVEVEGDATAAERWISVGCRF
ncbi:MAG: hypothetical protein QOH90_25 [Actinomycetota bacterium]|nr:hypothetical protein [Actinomycetota bacterium]